MTILLPIQLLLFLFVIFAASRAVLQFRGGTIRFGMLSFWLMVWIFALIAIFYPEQTTQFAKILGINRGADIIMYASISLLFYLVFRLYVYLESMRTEISTLIREMSLKKITKGKHS